MRDILTGLAVILIVVLTTLLVAPYFVDWNGQRVFLETQLSRALGQRVTIGGSIDLKLLPTPYIRLNQTVIGGDEGPVRIGIHHLDLELAVAPLLHGEFDIVEGRLDEPTMRLTLQADRTLPAMPETPALKAKIRLERIMVKDGTLAVADPTSGRTFVVGNLDFSADAPSLAGPFKGSGVAGASDDRTKFRFSATEAKKGRAHVHLGVNATAIHPAVDVDGDVALEKAAHGVRQSFVGTIAAIGTLAPSDGAPLAWQITGPLDAGPAGAQLKGGELRFGPGDGLALKADIATTFGEAAAVTAHLSSQQLDIDRLSGPPGDPTKPVAPPQLPSWDRLRALLQAAMPAVPAEYDVTIDNAIWGGETLSDIALRAKPNPIGSGTLTASADGPGGFAVSIDGTLGGGGDAFDGYAKIGAGDLPRALAWLQAVAPDLSPSRGALPFTEANASGAITIDKAGIAAQDATVLLDRSQLKGSLKLAFGDSTHQARLGAVLRTDKLDLEALPDLRALRRGAMTFAYDLKLDAGAVQVANFGTGSLDAGRTSIDAAGRSGRTTLRAFRVDDLGGATLTAKGEIEAGSAMLEAALDAEKPDATTALARQIAPGAWTDAILARAPDFGSTHLHTTVSFAAAGQGGGLAPTRLTLDGNVGGTKVTANLAPADGSTSERLSAEAENADGAKLLRQFGLPTAPTPATSLAKIVLSASGVMGGPLATRLDAALGATHLAVEGRFEFFGKSVGGSGKAELNSPDLGPTMRTLGLVSPDASTPVPADLAAALAVGQDGLALSDIKGRAADLALAGTLKLVPEAGDAPVVTGALDLDALSLGSLAELALGPRKAPASNSTWSSEPFGAPAAAVPRSDITLRAKRLELGSGLDASDASLDVRLGPGLVAVQHGEAKIGGGHLGGSFTLRRDGQQATLDGSLSADDTPVALPALKAGLSGKLDFAGGGGTKSALVASLAGSGAATLTDTTVPGADPAALPRVFASVEDDSLAVDQEAVTRAFDEGSRAPLMAGTRHGSLSLAGGLLTFSPTAEGAPSRSAGVTSTVGATLDLRATHLDVRATETLNALPKDWSGPRPSIVVTQTGPIAAPHRGYDVAAFLDAVAARAIARESARLEAYEFDIRERALFNTRLQSDRRREQDRLKAEADAKAAAEAMRRAADLARKVEAERRAKAEAARLERQRAEGAPQAPAPAPTPGESPPAPPAQFQTAPPNAATDPTNAGRY